MSAQIWGWRRRAYRSMRAQGVSVRIARIVLAELDAAEPSKETNTVGPDFTNCGNPVDWADDQPIDDHFPQAIMNALASPTVDIELARWSKDDTLIDEYTKWWNGQLAAIRRYLATMEHGALKPIVSRRTDKGDGLVKCYVRFDRRRPKAVAA